MQGWVGWIARCLVLPAVLLLADVAAAQIAPAPDVVVLKDGSRYRGTIAEVSKDGPVTIVLITGETRKLDAADVTYAGPTTAEPPPASAAPEAVEPAAPNAETRADAAEEEEEQEPTNRARVHFESNREYTEFFVRSSDKTYRRLCTAPCVRELKPAKYRFGVRFAKDEKVKVLQSVLIEDTTRLALDFRSKSSIRGAGAMLLVIGCLAATASSIYLAAAERPDKTMGYVGLGTGIGAGLIGLTLASFNDEFALTIK